MFVDNSTVNCGIFENFMLEAMAKLKEIPQLQGFQLIMDSGIVHKKKNDKSIIENNGRIKFLSPYSYMLTQLILDFQKSKDA